MRKNTTFFLDKRVRPEFRRLIRKYPTYNELAEFLGTSPNNVAKQKQRGYLSVKFAKIAETNSDGKYKARLLSKRGEIQ